VELLVTAAAKIRWQFFGWMNKDNVSMNPDMAHRHCFQSKCNKNDYAHGYKSFVVKCCTSPHAAEDIHT
jgi:hypothetical protein